MRRVRVTKATAIWDMCAWIVPTLELVGSDRVYNLAVHNGRGLMGHFKVTSKVVDPPATYFCGVTQGPTWIAEMRNVQARPVAASCPLGPAPVSPPLRLEINQIALRYDVDRTWRRSKTVYPVDFG